ncbi:hypothetical protein D4Q80_00115 [bacterium]|nr:MAG: hypothetical protein D4Q80_00115 [bacterium]
MDLVGLSAFIGKVYIIYRGVQGYLGVFWKAVPSVAKTQRITAKTQNFAPLRTFATLRLFCAFAITDWTFQNGRFRIKL